LFVYNIKQPEKYEINVINEFIIEESALVQLNILKGYGFSFNKISEFNQKDSPKLFGGELIKKYSDNYRYNEFNMDIDSFNFVFKPYQFNNQKGASGSPIFIYSEKMQPVFGGMLIANSDEYGIALKAKYIINELNKH
jgi:hypothetical protein